MTREGGNRNRILKVCLGHARVTPKEYIYHVLARGNNRQDLFEDKGERKRRYRAFVRGMIKEKEAMKGEMDRRIMNGGKDFVKEMTKTYKISEKIKQMGRKVAGGKLKRTGPLVL